MEPFLGSLMIFAGNFAPRGWAFCNGQLLSIAQNTALFSLLGTTYGGDGVTTFALPDLRGRAPIHFGQGPGLSNYVLGEASGTENVTLVISNLPAHSHTVNASIRGDGSRSPTNNLLASPAPDTNLYTATAADTTMNPTMIGPTGGSQPFNNMQPFLTLNYCIALEGIFPSRS